MAKGKNKERTPKPADAEEPTEEAASEVPEGEEASLAKREAADLEPSAVAEGDTEDAEAEEDDSAAAQLGIERYVLAAFFAGGMLLAYIAGRIIHDVWAVLANEDWFSRALPAMAAVGDDEKTTLGLVVGGVIALIVVLRLFRNPEIRTWADEVASELAKVKWPTKKEVTSATFIVITATTVATIYLTLLDRFWGFVTNIVYGDGS
jgi:preprotein translocase subunit SecE